MRRRVFEGRRVFADGEASGFQNHPYFAGENHNLRPLRLKSMGPFISFYLGWENRYNITQIRRNTQEYSAHPARSAADNFQTVHES